MGRGILTLFAVLSLAALAAAKVAPGVPLSAKQDMTAGMCMNTLKEVNRIAREQILQARTQQTSGALEILTTWEGNNIYQDRGTGADEDLSVFEPVLPDGYYMVGHFAQMNHESSMYGPVPIVKPLTDGVFAAPEDFEQLWNDKGSGGDQDVSFWRVLPPAGYVAVGDVINIGYDKPDQLKSKYACINADLVGQGAVGEHIWWDKGSGADEDGSLWRIQPVTSGVTGTFIAQTGYDPPSAAYALDMDAVVPLA